MIHEWFSRNQIRDWIEFQIRSGFDVRPRMTPCAQRLRRSKIALHGCYLSPSDTSLASLEGKPYQATLGKMIYWQHGFTTPLFVRRSIKPLLLLYCGPARGGFQAAFENQGRIINNVFAPSPVIRLTEFAIEPSDANFITTFACITATICITGYTGIIM